MIKSKTRLIFGILIFFFGIIFVTLFVAWMELDKSVGPIICFFGGIPVGIIATLVATS